MENTFYKLNWGFIGCGNVVETKSGAAFNKANESSIHAIMRRDLIKAKESVKLLNAKQAYDNAEDLLSDKDVNAIYIATPPGLHYEQAMACAKSKKPTYIEKPFARNFEECNAIIECFKENETPLFIAHYRRALPKFIKIKEMIRDGIIGKICEVDFRLDRRYSTANNWLYDAKLSGGGKFFDIAPHSIDILVYLFGHFKYVNGIAKNSNHEYLVEDIVTMNFQTESGIVGTANFNTISNKKEDQMIVSGTKGQMIFSIHGNDVITIKTQKGIEQLTISTPQLIEEPMIKNVINCLLYQEKSLCTGKDALETYRIIDHVLDKYYNGRNDQFWNRPNTWNTQGYY